MDTPLTSETAAEPQSTVLSSGLVLPELLWMLGDAEDAPLRVEKFLKIQNIPGMNKPGGGLWTSPVYEDYLPYRTTWWSLGLGRHRNAGPLWTVIPRVDTCVYVINSPESLDAALTRWQAPHPLSNLHLPDEHPEITEYLLNQRRNLEKYIDRVLDFEAMAEEFDAIWLTGERYGDFDSVLDHQNCNLWGWDGPSVLFLQPTFTVGPEWRVITDEQIAILEARSHARVLAKIEEHYAGIGEPVPVIYYRMFHPDRPV